MIYKARNFSYKTPAETRVFTSEQLGKGQINEFSPFYNSLKANGFRNRRFFYEKSMGEFSAKPRLLPEKHVFFLKKHVRRCVSMDMEYYSMRGKADISNSFCEIPTYRSRPPTTEPLPTTFFRTQKTP